MVILICGSRHIDPYRALYSLLAWQHTDASGWTIIHGDAPGADQAAKRIARDIGCWCEAFPADWVRHGKRAGPIRNQQMLDQKPDLVIACIAGRMTRGTGDMVGRARKASVPVVVLDIGSLQ
jgi:hypothetical protein